MPEIGRQTIRRTVGIKLLLRLAARTHYDKMRRAHNIGKNKEFAASHFNPFRFDTGNESSESAEPERFYHGFVLGLMVELADRVVIMYQGRVNAEFQKEDINQDNLTAAAFGILEKEGA